MGRDRREILSFYNIEFVIVKLFGYFQISYAMTCSMTTISVDDGGWVGIITLYTHCYDEEFRENSLACDLLPF